MSEDEISSVIEKIRKELLRKEREIASKLVHVYGEVWKKIREELARLQAEYESRVSKEPLDPTWILKYNRAQAFRTQIESELQTFSQYAEKEVQYQQREAIEAAQRSAEELVRKSLGKPPPGLSIRWNQIDTNAVATMLGITSVESPLHQLFTSISVEGAQAAEDALIQGVLLGKNPKKVAPSIRRALGIQLSRALTIARTETLRAHREATRMSYIANQHLVEGWIWHSALDDRTCPACWAMHGTVHPLSERLNDHPNGRCAMVPKTVSWEEIGERYGLDLDLPETSIEVQTGEEVFETLSEEKKMQILGLARYNLYKTGQFTLKDFVSAQKSRVWGSTIRTKSANLIKNRGLQS